MNRTAKSERSQSARRSDTGFLDIIRADLDVVEAVLRSACTSEVHQVDALAHHVLMAGGKRLRPSLVILGARAVCSSPDTERLVAVAAAMELVHTATLVHDDVVDNTSVRRGTATANAVFGNGVAVISGDFLLARAVRMLAREGDMRVIRAAADITVEMSEGEVLEMVATGEPDLSDEEYFGLIRKKTAVFIEGCCRCGGIVGGAAPDLEEALANYGLHVGLAFQLTDDLLDYIGDPAVTGKPTGTDLREGRATLPLLLGLREARDGKRERLLSAFANPNLRETGISVVVRSLEHYGAFDRARAEAVRQSNIGKNALSCLAPTPFRDALTALADYVVERDR